LGAVDIGYEESVDEIIELSARWFSALAVPELIATPPTA